MGKHVKTCVICGDSFKSPRSSNKRACSPVCSSKVRSLRTSKHGESGTRLHNIWCGMRSRIKGTSGELGRMYYKSLDFYEAWKTFSVFRDWALSNGYQDDLEINRIDNAKGYSPENCRWANRHQQMCNQNKWRSKTTSRFRGVSLHSQNRNWVAQGYMHGKPVYLGSFRIEQEAARAYDAWAKQNYGTFASLNFKEIDLVSS